MMEFGKRLSWRLTGGIAAVAIGALAAAQAQRQNLPQESDEPQLHQPADAASAPQPIAAQEGPPSPVQPAGFMAAMPSTNQQGFAEPDSGENLDNAPPTTLVAQVAHEEPIDEPGGYHDLDSHDESGAHEETGTQPPAAFHPAGMMGLPNTLADPNGQSEMQDEFEANDGPAMAMSFMGLPQEQTTPPTEHEQPQHPTSDSPAPDQADPEMLETAPLPEIQMDQGPMMMDSPSPIDEGPAIDSMPPSQPPPMPSPVHNASPMHNASPINDEPAMYDAAPRHDAAPMTDTERIHESAPMYGSAPAMEGFAADQASGPGASFGGNSLRQPAGMENHLRSATAQADQAHDNPYQPPLPELPQPTPYQDDGAPQGMYENGQPARPTPAQYAGHQRGGDPAIALPGQRGPGGGLAQDAYLAAGNEPISINLPGDRRLEGVQTPSVVIHKRAPAEVKVGQPATFVIQVRNAGTTEALGVLVHDRVPAGMQLVDATPTPTMQGDLMVWEIGALPAGDERSITMQLVPQEEGELGSVARVTFEAAASVRTRSTRPELKITQRAPQKVLIGQQLEIELEVANVGTGAATGVILQADVPPGLDHPNGRQLDNSIGALRPGEVRREVLRMRAVEPGMIENVVHLTSEDAQPVTHSVNVEVVAPGLRVAISGPSRRFLERQATYNVNIENPGTASARNVEVLARLDRGFTFVGTENNGQYDPNRHAVRWSIVELPAGESASVPVTLLPIEAGDQVIRMEASADLDTRSESEHTVAVESKAELTFSIADTADPIELGSETTYEIKVRNAGSRNDTNVQVQLILPPGLEMLESDSDAGTDGRGGVLFAPHDNLAAGADLTYRIRVRGVQPDTHVMKAIVTSDQSRVPVTKEESTMVYADR